MEEGAFSMGNGVFVVAEKREALGEEFGKPSEGLWMRDRVVEV